MFCKSPTEYTCRNPKIHIVLFINPFGWPWDALILNSNQDDSRDIQGISGTREGRGEAGEGAVENA